NFGDCKKPPAKSSISGFVYSDTNADGMFNNGDTAIEGAVVTLTGAEDGGAAPLSINATTDANGAYSFDGLNPGTYALDEQQPDGFLDGQDSAGTPFGGTAAANIGQDNISDIVIQASDKAQTGTDYNF